jgi:hypothetical protein
MEVYSAISYKYCLISEQNVTENMDWLHISEEAAG